MTASNTLHGWKPQPSVARVLAHAPDEAVGPEERVVPLRKRPDFTPAVQRWSHQLPDGEKEFRMALFGAQAPDQMSLLKHPLLDWVKAHVVSHKNGPTCIQQARTRTAAGVHTHVICAYWVSDTRFLAWEGDAAAEAVVAGATAP